MKYTLIEFSDGTCGILVQNWFERLFGVKRRYVSRMSPYPILSADSSLFRYCKFPKGVALARYNDLSGKVHVIETKEAQEPKPTSFLETEL